MHLVYLVRSTHTNTTRYYSMKDIEPWSEAWCLSLKSCELTMKDDGYLRNTNRVREWESESVRVRV